MGEARFWVIERKGLSMGWVNSPTNLKMKAKALERGARRIGRGINEKGLNRRVSASAAADGATCRQRAGCRSELEGDGRVVPFGY